jgi:alpha-D-ribose 1-methylphosphonate 5-triphosphate synthase subunit PhnH
MSAVALKAGFDEPIRDSQRTFRAVLDAMAHPGRIVTPPSPPEIPLGLHPATAAVCLTFLDFETSLWLAGTTIDELRPWLAFHAGCPFASDPAQGNFALVTDAAAFPALDRFALGSDETPEHSTTLILQVDSLANRRGMRLSGPGIDGSRALSVTGLPDAFWRQRAQACALFPRGIDILLTSGSALVALPRTTQAED